MFLFSRMMRSVIECFLGGKSERSLEAPEAALGWQRSIAAKGKEMEQSGRDLLSLSLSYTINRQEADTTWDNLSQELHRVPWAFDISTPGHRVFLDTLRDV